MEMGKHTAILYRKDWTDTAINVRVNDPAMETITRENISRHLFHSGRNLECKVNKLRGSV